MTGTIAIFRRELAGYFATPVAYVFIVGFLLLAGIFTFYVGGLFERGQADLKPFFMFHPWLYVVLMPAVAMRLWAEERRSGTIELLLTLPVGLGGVVLGKFLAAWAFTAVALALTFPAWITVNLLGDPDNGVILAGYVGSLFMAGGYLAISACLSALTRNQVVAFVVGVVVCLLFTVAGSPMVLDAVTGWAPRVLVDALASFSFLTRFSAIMEGVIDLRDVVYFASLIAVWLFANTVAVDLRKAG
ncbi:ABC transporter permease subunit [Azospirillum sp.]|uniref:ABC transporter permease subunit n=1 Tax=Azospirillum sp. TaxID=34012 RepID=UPI002D2A109C|nr:ABC transporter permease subunit [Azospirillum sp.]HYD70600.1 ABC transporter permease subunit [Azospirillum sp.]